jgi:ribose transport system permease protein
MTAAASEPHGTTKEATPAQGEALTALWHRIWPAHLVGEILTKRWMESVIPFTILMLSLVGVSLAVPHYFDAKNLSGTSRLFAEQGLVGLGFAAVVIGGGIDLSVGSVFALVNIMSQILLNVWGFSVPQMVAICLGLGAATGAINGLLIGVLRLRAFLTTLVTLVIFRAVVDILLLRYGTAIQQGEAPDSQWLNWLSEGELWHLPSNIIVLIGLALVCHLLLSRSKPGWHLQAIGGSRRAAHNAGVSVRLTLFFTYVFCGVMVALAAVFYAARVSNTGVEVGDGLEFAVLTGVVLGGVSLGGGRGSVSRAMMGTVTLFIITNALVRSNVSGGVNSMAVGVLLATAVFIDVKYQKNRHKLIDRVYVSPTYLRLPKMADSHVGAGTAYEQNDALKDAMAIGLHEVEGPEDVILDDQDALYCGTRTGDIYRFTGENYEKKETFAHIGGRPLGLAFDKEGNIITCVAGMGVYGVKPDRTVFKLTDETNRSWTSVVDDSRLSLADDLDITRDGRVFFSEATVRYDVHSWPLDGLEGRGNGRLICHDPRTGKTKTVVQGLVFPNGVCMSNDGVSLLFAETWACRVTRYYFDGPKAGKLEVLIDDLPGFPDNINRASDGTYWLALMGMRNPAFDLAMRMPSFRTRMVRRIPGDEWLFPNINTGCIVKFEENGKVLGSMWDLGGAGHPMISSMREHKGYLYIGGVSNNRIGRIKVPGADPSFVAHKQWWGKS